MIDKTDLTNRDTVPAMLTPGEFVLNKEASQMYGPTIQKMNDAGLQKRAIKNIGLQGIPPRELNLGGETSGRGRISTEQSQEKPWIQNLEDREGFRDYVYIDTEGHATIGTGHKLPASFKKYAWDGVDKSTQYKPYSKAELDKMLLVDLNTARSAAKKNFSNWNELPEPVQNGLTNMAFQLGGKGQFKFEKMRAAVEAGDYSRAAFEANDSDWAKQTHDRSDDMVKVFLAQNPVQSNYDVPRPGQGYGVEAFGTGNSLNNPRPPSNQSAELIVNPLQDSPYQGGPVSPIQTTFLPSSLANDPLSVPEQSIAPPNPRDYGAAPNTPAPNPAAPNPATPNTAAPNPAAPNPASLPREQSFGEAFSAGRAAHGGGGGVFSYQGKDYSTDLEEESLTTANMGGQINKSVPMMYANHGTLIPSGLRADDDLHLPEVNSDEALLKGSSQSIDDARFKKQIEMQKFMEYQQQQRGIPNNQIPMTYDLETRQLGDPSYRQQASDNELFGGPLNFVNDGPTDEEIAAKEEAYFKELNSNVPEFNVPITPPRIQENPIRDDGLVVSPPPTFMGDVVPYSKRVGSSLLNTVKNDLSNYTDNLPESIKDSKRMMEINKIPEPKSAPINTDQLIQDVQTKFLTAEAESNINYLKNKQSNSTNVDEIISLDAQIKDQTDALKVTQKNMADNEIDRMRRKNMSPIVSQIQESADSANVSFDQLATKHIANVKKEQAEIQSILSRTDLNLSPEATTALTKKVTSLDALVTEITSSSTPPPVKVSPSNKLANKQMVQSLTTQLQQLDDVKGSDKSDPDPDNLPPTEQKDIPEAKSALKDFFGDIFDTKELARAAIMYLGGRATGMSGNQALAFAGKQYINRSDARENTYQKLAMSGKYSKASLALYRKTRDPNSLILKSVPLVNMGSPKELYDTITNKRFISQKMKDPTTGNMMYVKEDGVTPVDFTRTTEDARYVPATKENDQMRLEQTDRLSKMVTEFNNLENNQTDGATKNERRAYLQITPTTIGKSAVDFMIKNQISESAMGEILNNVMTEAVNDLKSNKIKNLNSIDSYFRKSYIQVETNDSVNFKLKDGNPVSPSSVKSFLNSIRQIGQDNEIKNLNDTNLSSWLMERPDYKTWQNMSQSDKQFYINEGMNNKENDRQSGMMVFILDKLAP